MSQPACEHTVIEGDVQLYRFTEPSRRAVDEFIIHLGKVVDTLSENQPHHAIIDIRESGMPSLAYLTAQLRKFIDVHRDDSPQRQSRVAVLYSSGAMFTIINTATQMFTRRNFDAVHFVQNDFDAALAWVTAETLTE